jgi:branched-chain amino acid transport system permease protein
MAAFQSRGSRSPASDLAALLVVTVAFATVPAWADKGTIFLASVVMINAVFALSYNYVFGLAGLVSFGHAAFFGAGAYTTGLLLQASTGAPFFVAWLASGVAGAVVAALVGVVALRRSSGIYFAILTLALAELIRVLVTKSTFLGREDGLTGIKRPTIDFGVFKLNLAEGNQLYYLTMVCTIALGALMWLLWHNSLGRQLAAIRQDPERVRFLGVNVHAKRLLAFVLSGAVAGLAGGLYAPAAQLLTPELVHWSHSALPILYCLVGGVSFFWGPVVGAILFIGVEHLSRNTAGLSEIVIGATLLAIVLLLPGGVMGGARKLQSRFGNRSKRALPVEARAGGASR